MYCSIRDYDAAINMYKQQQMYDHMLRLVAVHRRVRPCAAEHMVVAVPDGCCMMCLMAVHC